MDTIKSSVLDAALADKCTKLSSDSKILSCFADIADSPMETTESNYFDVQTWKQAGALGSVLDARDWAQYLAKKACGVRKTIFRNEDWKTRDCQWDQKYVYYCDTQAYCRKTEKANTRVIEMQCNGCFIPEKSFK
jgi:hypothetical protein